jgi:hypothetical protein
MPGGGEAFNISCPEPSIQPGAVGIRTVEAHEDATPPLLIVTLMPADAVALASELLDRRRYSLTGGARLHPRVTAVRPGQRGDQVILELDGLGDFSVYTLTVSGSSVDPLLGTYRLRFRLGCEAAFDCSASAPEAVTGTTADVAIDYLAKDYASFRQALLDFVPTRMPDWIERSEADVGMALLELMAATGDSLSYLQDRVASEAFLSTASQRRSVHDHLALLGYALDDGSSAAAWLQFRVAAPYLLPAGFQVAPQAASDAQTFETAAPQMLYPEQNEMLLYDWGNADCCLWRDATSAVLRGSLPSLAVGADILLSDARSGARDIVRLVAPPEEGAAGTAAGPGPVVTTISWSALTPLSADYCIATTVAAGNLVLATHGATVTDRFRVTADAVECLGSFGESPSVAPVVAGVAVPAEGAPGTSFVLSVGGFDPGEPVDLTIRRPDGTVESLGSREALDDGALADIVQSFERDATTGTWSLTGRGQNSGVASVVRWLLRAPASAAAPSRARLRVPLEAAPLAHVDVSRAAESPRRSVEDTLPSGPAVRLTVEGRPWQLVESLLECGPEDDAYRVEVDDDGFATLVFGRGGEAAGAAAFGRRPPEDSILNVVYRVGGGAAGNVGRDTLTRPARAERSWFVAVTNPLPAFGGRDRESREHARRTGASATLKRVVTVTAQDYETAAGEVEDAAGRPLVSRAGADVRWTGSWLTVSLAVDPTGTERVGQEVAAELLDALDRRRLAGYDLQLREPRYLPIDLRLRVSVRAGYLAVEVGRSVRRALSLRSPDDGGSGFFAPDRFSFGDPLLLSRLFDTVTAVPGVQAVTVERLAPLHAADPDGATQTAHLMGRLEVEPEEILQLDDDPNFPEHGRLTILTEGGR